VPLLRKLLVLPEDLEASAELLSGERVDAMLILDDGAYGSIDGRRSLLALCETCAYEAGFHIWLYDRSAPWVVPEGLAVHTGVVDGVLGTEVWPHTLRYVDADGEPVEGGSIRVASRALRLQPWNPLAGSDGSYDRQIITATLDRPFAVDPATGLPMPMWAESATVEIGEGSPVRVASEWCDLAVSSDLEVPADAWSDWDAGSQEFVTAGARFPGGGTARSRVTVRFPDDLWTRRWHDGSAFSPADCVLALILRLDRAKPDSTVYDESAVAGFETLMADFRGLRILSLEPFEVEVYTDRLRLDADAMASDAASLIWPVYATGPGPWHTVALGILAEEAGLAAFSNAKANSLGVDWLCHLGGPTLQILLEMLADAQRTDYVPYRDVLESCGALSEVEERYENLFGFASTYGHLWIGNGPIMIDCVDLVARIICGRRASDY